MNKLIHKIAVSNPKSKWYNKEPRVIWENYVEDFNKE